VTTPSYGRKAAAPAWALYDFAYSLFAFIVLIRFLPSWIIDDHHRPDWTIGVTQFVVVVLVLVAMPLTGAVADQLGRRKPFLIAFTLVACAAAGGLGFVPVHSSVLPALVVAAVSSVAAQLAFAQYDPLLADVAPEERRGRASGMAVALGFAGIVFGLAVIGELIVGDGDKQRAFAPAGVLYLLVALPAFVLVREPDRPRGELDVREAARRAVAQVVDSLRRASEYPHVFRFLGGRFLYSDAVVTLSAFLAVYMTRLGGFSEQEKNAVIGVAVVTAAGGALVGGRLVERFGPKRPLISVLPAFGGGVLLSALVGRPWTVWLLSPVAGGALGVIWTADRVLMLRLTPSELRGQFFGFFNLANRVASAIGPLVIWSGTVWLLHSLTEWTSLLGASRVAVGGLGLAAVAGWLVIRPLPDHTLERTKTVPVGT
jgi:UMF1 family MFS transporter